MLDRRFDIATAQYVMAGSFGLAHATILDWLHGPAGNPENPKAHVLNKAFDLKTRCLPALMTGPNRLQEAAMLAAASHSYSATLVPFNRTNTWDQLNWAQYWSTVFKGYNPGDRKYCTERVTKTNPKTKRQMVICDAQDGLSVIIQKGLTNYDPLAPLAPFNP